MMNAKHSMISLNLASIGVLLATSLALSAACSGDDTIDTSDGSGAGGGSQGGTSGAGGTSSTGQAGTSSSGQSGMSSTGQGGTGGAHESGTAGSSQAGTGGADLGVSGRGGAAGGEGGFGGAAGGEAGFGGAMLGESTICTDGEGTSIPYDYSIGIAGEYAFELLLDCDLGGYLEPIFAEDPYYLTAVDAYVMVLTDWFRARIIECADTETSLPENSFAVLPPEQSSGLTTADFNAAVDLFMAVLDRHDDLADGFSADAKTMIRERLEALEDAVVIEESEDFSLPSTAEECTTPQ